MKRLLQVRGGDFAAGLGSVRVICFRAGCRASAHRLLFRRLRKDMRKSSEDLRIFTVVHSSQGLKKRYANFPEGYAGADFNKEQYFGGILRSMVTLFNIVIMTGPSFISI